jgi:hypothetical protein
VQTKQKKQISIENAKGQVILYGNKLEVRLEQDTVWLTQKQMAELFQKDVRTINEHVTNIYEERELTKKPTIRKFRIVQKEGERIVERYIDFYNLDVIISVGYRVKSLRGTQFRIWATNVLRQHLVEGYTINEKRLKARFVFCVRTTAWNGSTSAASCYRCPLLNVCIYASAPGQRTVHPHLPFPSQAVVYSRRGPQLSC